MNLSTITLAAWAVAFLGGTAVPVLTGLVTKLEATSGTKAFVGVVLSAVVAVLAAIVNANGVADPHVLLPLFIATFWTHVTTFYGWWRPVGGGAAPGAKATASTGIG